MSRRLSLLIKLMSAVFLLGVVWMLGGSSAHAWPLTPDPNSFGGGIATLNRNHLEGCNFGGPAFTTWVSPRDRGSAVSMDVTYGTASVAMQLNDAGAVCDPANHGVRYANWVESVGPGIPGTFVGTINDFTFSNPSQLGNYGYARGFFDYSPPGGFTTSGVYTITITARSILESHDGPNTTFNCVGDNAPANHLYDWGSCQPEPANFRIYINVVSPVEGRIEGGGCDIGSFRSTDRGSVTTDTQASLIGWAKDRDYDFTQVHVYIQVDPSNLVFVGSYDANRYPRSLNGADLWASQGRTPYGTGVPDWHNWFVVPKADMDRFADAYTHTVRVFGIGKNADGSANGDNREIFRSDGSNLTIGPCAPPTCTAVTDPAPPEPGVPFNIILSYIYNPGAQGRPISPIGTVTFNTRTDTWAFPSSRTGDSHPFTNYTQNVNGTFTINASISQAGAFTATCNNPNVHVANRPYVKVYGNDVSVGGKFADAATPNTCSAGPAISDASIWAFDKKVSAGGNNYYGGASSQFGASALGKIESFFSAGARNGLNEPKPAVGLSFGNMLNGAKVTNYGGDSGLHRCIPNYYSGSTQPGADVRPGGTTITSADAPSPNQQKAIFVNGDAYISGNLNYPGVGSWANISQIPSLYIIAKGNIYIDNNVSTLDGVFVAQPDNSGNRGTIYTCTNGSSLYDPDQLFSNCQTQLTVTGSFIANQVKYLRAKGTVGLSIPSAPAAPVGLTLNYTSAGSPGTCILLDEPGENFNHTWWDNVLCSSDPDLYWVKYPGINPSSPGFKKQATDTCLSFAPRHSNDGIWLDNALCWPVSDNLQLTWSNSNDSSATKSCILIYESQDPRWSANSWLCVPIPAALPYTPINEPASSPNIAEVFNFSQELYLAPAPTVLQTIIGPSSPTGKTRYESITSLPPIL